MGDALKQQYARAAEDARLLPNDLLSNAQRLKLFALFKQAEGPAPEVPPPRTNAVGYAKWEAWNDVRSLSKEQAMESYCAIIEGLVSLTRGKPQPEPVVARTESRLTRPVSPPQDEPSQPAPAPPAAGSGGEPVVECVKWETSSLRLDAGAVVEVPLQVSEPSLCTFSITVVEEGSSCGFSLAQGSEQLATERGGSLTGTVEVSASGPLLVASIDNLASMFQSLSVACTLTLEPLSQLQARENFRERAEMRQQISDFDAELAASKAEAAALLESEATLRANLRAMQAQLNAAQQELTLNAGRQVACERRKLELEADKASLRHQLGGALWALPRETTLAKLRALSAAGQ